jgi:fructokinase
VKRRLADLKIGVELIQTDSASPTGTVIVTVSPNGTPAYTIREHVAWDRISDTPEAQSAVATADAVCFGTLAQRSGPA